MKPSRFVAPISALTAALFIAGSMSSSAVVVLLSDGVAPGTGVLEGFLNSSFGNVTQIRHGNFALYSAATTQDALNGTGAYAGMGAADVVIIGRTLASADYDAFDSSGYNTLTIPVVALTSYTVRQDANRLGWHASAASTTQLVAGNETTVTAAGASVLGLPVGTYDLNDLNPGGDFNGLGVGTASYGGASILATIGGDTLAAYWATGSAPGNTTAATVATFAGPRLLFNIDNDPNTVSGNFDLINLTPTGKQALVSAIDFATPLTAIPEPSSNLMGLASLGLLARRRR